MNPDFLAGYLSGAASIVIGNPLDLLKVRLQASKPAGTPKTPRANLASARTLLAGLPAPVATYGALNAVLFASYNRSLALVSPASHRQAGATRTSPAHFLSGAVAGLATFFISTPTEVVKCRAQVAESSHPPGSSRGSSGPPGKSPNSWTIARGILVKEGVRGFFVGGAVTALRDAIGYGFYFAAYEAGKEIYGRVVGSEGAFGPAAVRSTAGEKRPDEPSGSSEAVKILLCGGVAGVATWVSVFPLDVVKTRVQTQGMLPGLVGRDAVPSSSESDSLLPSRRNGGEDGTDQSAKFQRKGAWTIAKEAYATEGLSVFWRGIGLCCARAFIVNAAQWAVYEWVVRQLRKA